MKLGKRDRERLETAFHLAARWHAKQARKGSEIPYLSHLLQVAGLVLEHGGDAEQTAAAFLHDALEDAESPKQRRRREQRIAKQLGPRVLRIALDCTDTQADESAGDKRPWRERKERYLAHLRGEDPRSLLVAACDKRHNLGAIVGDVQAHGVGYLERFNAGPADQLWYYGEVLDAVRGRGWTRLERELADLLAELARLVEAGGGDAEVA